MTDRIEALATFASRAEGQRDQAEKVLEATRTKLKSDRKKHGILTAAVEVLKQVAEERREAVVRKIEKLVTWGLQVIFGEDHAFRFELGVKRGQMSAVPLVGTPGRDGKTRWEHVLNACGGGIVDVTAFLLRVIAVLLSRPRLERFVLFDEPFVHVKGRRNLAGVERLVKELARKAALRMLIVIRPDLDDAGDMTYRFAKTEGRTKAERV